MGIRDTGMVGTWLKESKHFLAGRTFKASHAYSSHAKLSLPVLRFCGSWYFTLIVCLLIVIILQFIIWLMPVWTP